MNNKTLIKLLVYTSFTISGFAYADDENHNWDDREDNCGGGSLYPSGTDSTWASGVGFSGVGTNSGNNTIMVDGIAYFCDPVDGQWKIDPLPPLSPESTGSSNPSSNTTTSSNATTSIGTTSGSSQVNNVPTIDTSSPESNGPSQITNSSQSNNVTNGQTVNTNNTDATTTSTGSNIIDGTTHSPINSLGAIISNSSTNTTTSTTNATTNTTNVTSNTTPQNWGAPPVEEYADHWAVTRPHVSVLIDISNKVKNKTKLKFNCTSNGCAVDNGDYTITYTPSSNFVSSSGIAKATDTFSYTYTNEQNEQKSGIVKVMVMEDRHYWNFVSNWNMGGYWTYNDTKSSYWDYVGVDQNGNYYSRGDDDNSWSYEGQDKPDQSWVSDSNDPNYWSYYGNQKVNEPGTSILTDPDHWSYTGSRDKSDQYYGSKPNDFLNWSVPAACQLIYAVHDEGVRDSQILTVDPKKGYTSVPLGPLHKSYDIEAMGISPKNHRLYALSGGSAAKDYRGNLFVVDPRTGDLAVLGKSGFDDITAIAFHPNGTLWAWSKGTGIIQVNPETGQGVIRARFTTLEMEGLAWSTDGSVLYATENENLWIYTGGSLAKTCNNFPGQVEALETLNDGLLLFAVDKDRGNNIYAYDPQTCSVVSGSSFVTIYSDIESIAWASNCHDEYQELTSWSGEFNHDQGFLNEEGDELVCLEKPQWITATASISLNPLPSLAHLETSWEVVTPQETACPPKRDQYGRVVQRAEDNCLKSNNPLQMTTGKSEFSISGWWPGMVKDSEQVSEVLFTARILDLNGDPLPGYEAPITKRVRGVCGAESSHSSEELVNVAVEKAQPASDTAALEQYFYDVLMASKVDITEKGEVTVIIDNVKYNGVLSTLLPEADVSNDGKLAFEQVPDLNADGYDDYIVTYPNGQQQQLFYLGVQSIENEVIDEVVDTDVENATSEVVDEVVDADVESAANNSE